MFMLEHCTYLLIYLFAIDYNLNFRNMMGFDIKFNGLWNRPLIKFILDSNYSKKMCDSLHDEQQTFFPVKFNGIQISLMLLNFSHMLR